MSTVDEARERAEAARLEHVAALEAYAAAIEAERLKSDVDEGSQ